MSLRANWELVPLVWLETLLLGLLGFASLVPFYLVLDLKWPRLEATPDEGAAWMLETLTTIGAGLGTTSFWLALLSSSAILLASLVCYSFFQAGVFGVLASADRQAPERVGGERAWFRTFSWAEFQGAGGRYLWRFFWLFNLFFLFWLGWMLLGALALLVIGLVAEGAGGPLALALGCVALVPMLALVVVMLFWSLFAQAALVEADCGPWEAALRGLAILTRRLGGVALLFLVMLSAGVVIGMIFVVASVPLNLGLLGSGGLQLAATLALQALQWLISGLVNLTITGAVIAMLRGQTALRSGVPGGPAG